MPLRDRSSHSRRRSYSRSDSDDSYSRRRSHSRRSYSRSSSPDPKKRYRSRDSSSTSSNHYVSDSSNSKRYNKTRTSRFEDYGNTQTSTSHYNDNHEKRHTSTSHSRHHDSHDRSTSSRFIHDKVQDTFHRPEPKQYPPSSSIALRGLVFSVTESIVWNEIKAYGCIGCKVMSEQNTCRSKGYGFADFCTVEDAQAFMNQFPYSCDMNTKGNVFKLSNSEVTLEYSDFSRKSSGKGGDWICPVCHGMNFSRRNQCFTCSNPRVKTSLDIDRLPFEFVSVETNHILLSGLGSDVTEDMISEVIRSFCNYVRIFIYKDINQYSRGYCLVDLDSIQAASHIVTYCQSTPLKIKQYTILVGFASEKAISDSYQPVNERSTYIPAPSLSLAPLAPVTNSYYDSQQIQQMLYNTSIASLNVANSLNTSVETPSVQVATTAMSTEPLWPVHFEISCSDYIYDASSGYYFEPHSQFYYLPSKKLYLNSITGKYYIYNMDTVSFDVFIPSVPAEPYDPESFVKIEPSTSTTNAVSSSVTISASSSSIHNTKSSSLHSTLPPTKKISLVFNKKSLAKTINNNESKEEEEERKRKEQLKTAMELQKKQEKDSLKIKTVNLVQKKISEKIEEAPSTISTPSSTVPPPITGVTASGKHACYICKRQFDTMDKLFKHIELSTLHQKSMEIYNKQYNIQSYRNRAEERRQDTTILPSLSVSSNQNQHAQQTSLSSKLTENTVQNDSIADNLLNKMGWKNQSTSTDNFDDSYFESMTHNNGKGLGY